MEVVVPFQTHTRCAIEYFPNSITDGMICAGENIGNIYHISCILKRERYGLNSQLINTRSASNF